MSDDRRKKGKQDRSRVDTNQDYEVPILVEEIRGLAREAERGVEERKNEVRSPSGISVKLCRVP